MKDKSLLWQVFYFMGGIIYPITFKLDEQESWDNRTPANVSMEGTIINVNEDGMPTFFNNLLKEFPETPYTCPASSRILNQDVWEYTKIGHLSHLTGILAGVAKGDQEYHRKELIEWVNTLSHLNETDKNAFIEQVNRLGQTGKKKCVLF